MNTKVVFDLRLKKSGSQYRNPETGRFIPRPKEKRNLDEITFRCKFCGEEKPLDEMRTLTRFFPPLLACRECERRIG